MSEHNTIEVPTVNVVLFCFFGLLTISIVLFFFFIIVARCGCLSARSPHSSSKRASLRRREEQEIIRDAEHFKQRRRGGLKRDKGYGSD